MWIITHVAQVDPELLKEVLASSAKSLHSCRAALNFDVRPFVLSTGYYSSGWIVRLIQISSLMVVIEAKSK